MITAALLLLITWTITTVVLLAGGGMLYLTRKLWLNNDSATASTQWMKKSMPGAAKPKRNSPSALHRWD